jgi:hypothetical protein
MTRTKKKNANKLKFVQLSKKLTFYKIFLFSNGVNMGKNLRVTVA